MLQLADVEKSFMVETDASDFAVAGVLLQQGEDMDLLLYYIIYSSFTREFPTGVSAFLQGTLGII